MSADKHKGDSSEIIKISAKLMNELAQSAARTAAETISKEVRAEMSVEAEKLRQELISEIKSEIQKYHGDMTPTEHAIQHNRLDKLLNLIDSMTTNFWSKFLVRMANWLFYLFLLGYFLWTKGSESGLIPGAI